MTTNSPANSRCHSDKHFNTQHNRKLHKNTTDNKTRAQLSLGLADRTHGEHSQPASITVRVWCFEHVVAYARNVNVVTRLFT